MRIVNWFEKVSKYIEDNLELYIAHFFSMSNQFTRGKSIWLNPSPCCGHNDCFSLAKDKPVGHCFSCGTKGNHIQLVEEVWGKEEGRDELAKWSGIAFEGNRNPKVETEEERFNKRVAEIHHKVIEMYHHYLMNTQEGEPALKKQIGNDLSKGERSHTEESLKKFKVGLGIPNFGAIRELLARDYTEEEINEAQKLVWVPPNYYVYPYYDVKGNLIRINTKPFIRSCKGKRDAKTGKYDYSCTFETLDTSKKAKREHEEQTGHSMSPDAYSAGSKDFAYFRNPESKMKKKYGILVEGENDVISVEEALVEIGGDYERQFTVIGIGGNVREGFFESPFFRQFEHLYEAFDPDDAGDRYRELLNKEAPDIKVYHLPFDEDLEDIDNHLKAPIENKLNLKELIDNAEFVESKELLFERKSGAFHEWVAKNRSFKMDFKITKYNRNGAQFEGIMHVYQGDELIQKKTGGIDKIGLDAAFSPARLKLSKFLEEYYNEVPWNKGEPKRPFDELIDIVVYTKNYNQVCKQIAWYLYKTETEEEYQRLYNVLRNKVTDERLIAEVLKEVNGYTNTDIDPHQLFPKVNLTQHFSITHNDAFFYFSRVVKDGDTPKLVPCLITNHKEEIRLDLLKRKDPQSLLLIKNRYELPFDVEIAVMEPVEVSLQPYWVDRWKANEVDEDEINPSRLIQEIEEFIARCYYLDKTVLKVLSLWIYSTYYYMLFKSGFPYLLFTGEKGTGKSTLDTLVYLLSINAKMALDMSESALYRTITFEGGTFILDEVEHLTDKRMVDSNGYAKILKGGYSDNAYVYRSNPDKGNVTDRFSVFGPKVISNINGIEDVIADRCIYVRTYRVPEEKLRDLEDVQVYKEERRSEAHSITSRCVLSALNNFQQVYEIFSNKNMFETGNARLSQILRPLITIARLVGGDYEEHLVKFYNEEIKQTKEEIAENTVEGMVKRILKTVARELTGIEKRLWATDKELHLYTADIPYNAPTQTFEIDTLHIKMLCEEMDSTQEIELKQVNSLMKSILGPKFDLKEKRRKTTASLTDESLQKLFGGKRTLHVYRYILNIQDFLSVEEFNTIGQEKESVTLF